MLGKINRLWKKRQPTSDSQPTLSPDSVRKLVSDAYAVGYNDGKRDGLAIARQQAIKTVKELLWEQNKTQQ